MSGAMGAACKLLLNVAVLAFSIAFYVHHQASTYAVWILFSIPNTVENVKAALTDFAWHLYRSRLTRHVVLEGPTLDKYTNKMSYGSVEFRCVASYLRSLDLFKFVDSVGVEFTNEGNDIWSMQYALFPPMTRWSCFGHVGEDGTLEFSSRLLEAASVALPSVSVEWSGQKSELSLSFYNCDMARETAFWGKLLEPRSEASTAASNSDFPEHANDRQQSSPLLLSLAY